jgi:hypothetical protein
MVSPAVENVFDILEFSPAVSRSGLSVLMRGRELANKR